MIRAQRASDELEEGITVWGWVRGTVPSLPPLAKHPGGCSSAARCGVWQQQKEKVRVGMSQPLLRCSCVRAGPFPLPVLVPWVPREGWLPVGAQCPRQRVPARPACTEAAHMCSNMPGMS